MPEECMLIDAVNGQLERLMAGLNAAAMDGPLQLLAEPVSDSRAQVQDARQSITKQSAAKRAYLSGRFRVR